MTQSFEQTVNPVLRKYCVECHGGDDDVHGDVDFVTLASADQAEHLEVWARAVELITDGSMPPEDAPQLTDAARKQVTSWYGDFLLPSIKSHPGEFRPRRLSAHEYRNTLRTLMGFDLEVAIIEAEQTVTERSLVLKLLPIDPPGPSGFKNDTSASPLTTHLWNQYAYLAEQAISQLLSPQRRPNLESMVGTVNGDLQPEQAERLLRAVAFSSRRRHGNDDILAESLAAIEGRSGEDLRDALHNELKVILVSPSFLYRGLLLDVPRDSVQPVDEYELAERLSYFLWGDMPDAELFELARSGQLSLPDIYRKQVDRMMASPKSRNLADDFGRQWFSLDEIDKANNNPPIAQALKQQPLDFIDHLFRDGRPITELIDSRTTFINHLTAKYYPEDRRQLPRYQKQKGIEIEARPNSRITLVESTERGGLLTMPGILAMNRGPVIRGTWMLERVLGEHLPDPPANVGQVPPSPPGENLTFRQRFEMHRSNPTCAVCHDKIDPLGFALQRYDSSGGYVGDKGNVDTSGTLPTGEAFRTYAELKQILVTTQREKITRNVVRRTLQYALCRKLQPTDNATVESIVTELVDHDGTFHDLVHLVTTSLPFTHTELKSQTAEDGE